MPLQSFYPVLMAEDVAVSARFYTEHMGFAPTFESDWYVSLRHRENPAYELAVLSPTHETIPDGSAGSLPPASCSTSRFRTPLRSTSGSRRRACGSSCRCATSLSGRGTSSAWARAASCST